MYSRNRRTAVGAASILAIAGLAATTFGQVERDRDQTERQSYGQTGTARQESTAWHFCKGEDLLGMNVEDSTGETIATVSDLIFERGSGRITHAVLAAGGVLGIGSKEFAVPYARLQYLSGDGEGALGGDDNRFTTDIQRDDIERAPEFRAEEWANLDHTTWWEETKSWFGADDGVDADDWDTDRDGLDGDDDLDADDALDRDDDLDADDALDRDDNRVDPDRQRQDSGRHATDHMQHQADPYADKIREGQREELRGTVKSIDRAAGEDNHTIVTVETADGDTKTVLFGPSWYVMTQEGTPYRNEEITLEVCPIEGGEADYVACKSKDPSKEYTLRDEQGQPSWSSGTQRLMLMSDLVGAEATLPSRDDTGDVEDVIVEANSGNIVLVALDANENFLGVGDDLKAVPWPVVRVVDSDTVRIDATEEMLTSSEEIPDEVTELATRARLEPLYTVYEVEIAPMERRSASAGQDWTQPTDLAQDDPIQALRDGEEMTVSGRVTDVSAKTVTGFDSEMMVASIDTDEGSKEVILGTKKYFDENPIMVSPGDEVHIQAKSAQIDGRECLAATTLDANGQETALWSGDQPLWQDD
ncbi:MAG TPA: PRC-barrel domain-containing protein [Phycisphaerales bacterium]|nr:PRC-barrel domain-containing protein [Phycisphaerales bacterium]